jgi:prepilin-type processing-associated H-X9-DG protein
MVNNQHHLSGFQHYLGYSTTPNKLVPDNGGRLPERHLETINVLYCDGHVKANKLTTLTRKTGAVMPASLSKTIK